MVKKSMELRIKIKVGKMTKSKVFEGEKKGDGYE